MELPNFRKSGGDMLNGIKSKLGFASDSGRDDYDDYYADDRYGDDYSDDYGEYGYSDDYADDSYGDDYASSSRTRSRASSSHDVASPKLVSIDDVRARTQVPERLNRDPLPHRSSSSYSGSSSTSSTYGSSTLRRGNRVLIDNTAPSPGSPESMRATRSAGLNSLFEPTDDAADSSSRSSTSTASASSASSSFAATAQAASALSAASQATAPASASATSARTSSGYDPYDALTGSGSAVHAPSRGVTVVKPVVYGDVERVAKVVRAGDVAVLNLSSVPEDLSKRVLDFSFGVACYADARVDCVADKVFVIVRGDALTETEYLSLRSQGVL